MRLVYTYTVIFRFLVFLMIFLAGSSTIYLIYSYYGGNYPNPGKSSKGKVEVFIPPTQSEDFDWKIPDLPVGFVWKEVSPTSIELFDRRIFWYAYSDNDRYPRGEIVPTGKFYNVEISDKDKNYRLLDRSFVVDFSRNIESLGWRQAATLGGWEVFGPSADGVLGQQIGFIKLNGSLLREIVLDIEFQGLWEGPGNELKCPCLTKMDVFISEPIELSEYISGLEKR